MQHFIFSLEIVLKIQFQTYPQLMILIFTHTLLLNNEIHKYIILLLLSGKVKNSTLYIHSINFLPTNKKPVP